MMSNVTQRNSGSRKNLSVIDPGPVRSSQTTALCTVCRVWSFQGSQEILIWSGTGAGKFFVKRTNEFSSGNLFGYFPTAIVAWVKDGEEPVNANEEKWMDSEGTTGREWEWWWARFVRIKLYYFTMEQRVREATQATTPLWVDERMCMETPSGKRECFSS